MSQSSGYDGDGVRVKEVASGVTTYYLKSSAMGGALVAEINASGQKSVGYVHLPGGQLLARQTPAGQNSYIAWKNNTPAGTTQLDYNVGGAFGTGVQHRVELDPLGANVPLEYMAPPENQAPGDIGPGGSGGIMDARWGNFFDLSGGCTASGVAASCSDHMAQTNLEGQMRADLGERWYDLPGNNNEIERAEAAYEIRTYLTFAIYNWQKKKSSPNPTEPEGTFDEAYKSCLGELGKSTAPGLAQTDRILLVASRTGVDPTLLAVTWRFEGGLDKYGEFNFQPTNGFHTRDTNIGDVGPGQLHPPIWNKSPYTDGLNNPFGTNLNTGQLFNGNAFENLIVTGRALGKARGDQRADAPGYYRAGNHNDSRYWARVQNFKDHAGNYDKFFECLAKKGFSP